MAKGGKRPGAGRPKGSRNKRSLEVQRRLEEMGFDPVEMLVSFAQDEEQEPAFRAKCAADLLPYCYPRLQATSIDVKATVEHHAVIGLPVQSETWDQPLPDPQQPKALPPPS